jgi:short-subunit dehydrogenase
VAGKYMWRDKVVIITGASRGIGRAVAEAAAAQGARVGLIARNEADLRVTLARCAGHGAIAVADVADSTAITAAISALEAELRPVDVFVANAGIGAFGHFADIDPQVIDELVAVNVLGTMHAVRAVAPGMIARRRGHIVTIGSIAGRLGGPFEAVYSGTKFAQVGFTEALAAEMGHYGVGVSMVNPGPVSSSFFEARGHAYDRSFPKQVTPERVAQAVLRAVETGRLEQLVPGWFRQAIIFSRLSPRLHRYGTKRTFRAELAADAAMRAERERNARAGR